MSPALVYITVGDAEEAGRIGRALVEERLAASVNILDGVRSLYWWGGKIEQAKEVVVAKTRGSLVERLTERVSHARCARSTRHELVHGAAAADRQAQATRGRPYATSQGRSGGSGSGYPFDSKKDRVGASRKRHGERTADADSW